MITSYTHGGGGTSATGRAAGDALAAASCRLVAAAPLAAGSGGPMLAGSQRGRVWCALGPLCEDLGQFMGGLKRNGL